MSQNESPSKKKKRLFDAHFEFNNNYFIISTYAVMTFTVCVIIYKLLNNWREAGSYIGSIMTTLSPFLIAFLIAYFINPLVSMIDRILFRKINLDKHIKMHKFLSLLLAYVIFIGAIALVLTFVMPQLIDSLLRLVRQVTNIYDTINGWIATISEAYPNMDLNYVQSVIDDVLPDALTYLQTFMANIVPQIYDASMSIISWVVNIILAFVISCYLMSNKTRLKSTLRRVAYAVFDEDVAYKVLVLIKECNHIFSDYIIGKALDSLVIGILCAIIMRILGLHYCLLISLVVGITNMIPYFGPFIGAIPGLIILLIVSPVEALIFLILILAPQQFDGAILGPKILGSTTGLQPIWIIFAITVGGALGGVLGMFLGVPIVAVLVYLANNLLDYLLYIRQIKPDLSNVDIPDINPDNIFIPKEFLEAPAPGQTETSADTKAATAEAPADADPAPAVKSSPEVKASPADADSVLSDDHPSSH